MELKTGDTVIMKKKHPCGGNRMKITRVGMDIKLLCLNCGHEIMLPRRAAEKNIKQVVSEP